MDHTFVTIRSQRRVTVMVGVSAQDMIGNEDVRVAQSLRRLGKLLDPAWIGADFRLRENSANLQLNTPIIYDSISRKYVR